MAHNVEYFSYPEKVNRVSVKENLDDYVAHEDWQEGCCGLYNGIRWLDATAPLPDWDAARQYLEQHDRGYYDNIAVRYYRPVSFTNEKLKQLEQKQQDAYREWEARDNKVYPQTLTSAFIGCKNCGSRLSVKHLHHNNCPVCGKDMRPASMQKSIEAAKIRFDKARAAAVDYVKKHAKKEVWWLLKIEYHT